MTRKELLETIKGMKKGDYNISVELYLKNRKGEYNWQFRWKSGGWLGFNDVWAKTEKEAHIKAAKITSKLEPDLTTFRKATREMQDHQTRMGNLKFIINLNRQKVKYIL